jgi:PST family polysaccharide transporter
MISKPQVKFRSAVKWALVMNWGTQGIAALVTFVLAAILGPKDYGLVAMAMLYISFIQMFLAQGLAAAIVQRKDLEEEHLDSVFWVTMLGGVVFCGISIALSGWWERVQLDAPGLARVIQALSVILIIRGLTIVQEAMLRRTMSFKKLAIRSNIAALVGGCVGVGMALNGFGVWSLVVQELVTSTCEVVLLWSVGTWRPRFRFSTRNLREVLGFSMHVFVAQLGTFVQRRSDALIIGLFFGPVAVGLYRLADRLINLVIEIATRPFTVVALPHFSRYQDDPDGLRNGVIKCIKSTTLVTLPLMALVAGLGGLICLTLG